MLYEVITFEDKVIEDLKNPYISGLSLLGGNPTDKRNLSSVIKLCSRVKKEIPEKTIWIWSGHIFENLVDNVITSYSIHYTKLYEMIKDMKLKF